MLHGAHARARAARGAYLGPDGEIGEIRADQGRSRAYLGLHIAVERVEVLGEVGAVG